MRRLPAFVKRGGGGLELAKIAGVVVRLNHIAGSQKVKEAHLVVGKAPRTIDLGSSQFLLYAPKKAGGAKVKAGPVTAAITG